MKFDAEVFFSSAIATAVVMFAFHFFKMHHHAQRAGEHFLGDN